ncbi:MAG TPA: HAD-IA family hydrolase [Burkholderiales bacterium]|nr:HAD-IA family hydrolase [Burkholderiales bacterium]
MKYRLLVFDWDGTIIDSASTIAECIRDASRDLALEVPERERARHVIGLGLHDAMRIVVPELPASRYPEFVASYRKHFLARKDCMQLFAGMRELLEELSGSHLLAIATGKSRQGLARDIEFHGLKALFAASRCADETHPKPHPAMLMELMAQLAVQSDVALMIGDTSHDLEMARAARVAAVAVTYGAHPEDGLRACGPLGCFSTVDELQVWLKANG